MEKERVTVRGGGGKVKGKSRYDVGQKGRRFGEGEVKVKGRGVKVRGGDG